MKKTKVMWKNQNNEILFNEVIFECELPRINEHVIYLGFYCTITDIERNFDKNEIEIILRQS